MKNIEIYILQKYKYAWKLQESFIQNEWFIIEI